MQFLKFDPLKDLFKTKHQLERELSELKAQTVEVETALSHCDRLEREIDGYIIVIKGRLNTDLTRDMLHVRALERVKKDLPEIRAHWLKRRRALAA